MSDLRYCGHSKCYRNTINIFLICGKTHFLLDSSKIHSTINSKFKVKSKFLFINLLDFHHDFGQIVYSLEFIPMNTWSVVHFVYYPSCNENEMKCKIKWNCLVCLVCFRLSTSNKTHSLVSRSIPNKRL